MQAAAVPQVNWGWEGWKLLARWGGCWATTPVCPVPPQAVLLCLLDLLPVLERAQRRQEQQQQQPRAPTHCDEVLQLLLTHMEAEHRLALRRVYAGTLPAFVRR